MSEEIKVRSLPYREGLVIETGPTQFGNNRPGIFISNADSFHFATCLGEFLALYEFPAEQTIHLEGLKSLLETCLWETR